MFKYYAMILIASVLFNAGFIEATVIVVNTTGDDLTVNGNCTLREAIQAANQNVQVDGCTAGNSSLDTIMFSVNGTLTMGSNRFIITEQVTIGGPGADNLTIVGTDGVFAVNMAVETHDFELIGVTLTGGDPGNSNGGAVALFNVDVATFTNVDFVENTAADGGAKRFISTAQSRPSLVLT